MNALKLYEIYNTVGGVMDSNKDLSKLTQEQFEWLVSKVEKLDKLHFDLLQTKILGERDEVKIDYIISRIETEDDYFQGMHHINNPKAAIKQIVNALVEKGVDDIEDVIAVNKCGYDKFYGITLKDK